MSLLFPLLLSWIVGWLVLRLLLKDAPTTSSFSFFIAVGLGLGISSEITFLSFICFNRLIPDFILGLHLLLLPFLWRWNAQTAPFNFRKINMPPSLRFQNSSTLIIVMASLIYCFAARAHPRGEWDAWAVWKTKSKFLISTGTDWQEIFRLHWTTQPDYPLLWPMLQAWGWMTGHQSLDFISLSINIYFNIAAFGLFFLVMQRWIGKKLTLVVSGLLIFNPSYIFLATAQYADNILGYYLLAGVILCLDLTDQPRRGTATALGLILGLMTFTKNEGMILAGILAGITLWSFWSRSSGVGQKNTVLTQWFLLGFALTVWPTVVEKFIFAPPNPDFILTSSFLRLNFLNWQGLAAILKYWADFLLKGPDYIWLLLIVLFCLNPGRYFNGKNKFMTLFFLVYFLILLFTYMTTMNFDLKWRLLRTWPRIAYYLLPSLLLWNFHVWYRPPRET